MTKDDYFIDVRLVSKKRMKILDIPGSSLPVQQRSFAYLCNSGSAMKNGLGSSALNLTQII
jgi:hypothetical protein